MIIFDLDGTLANCEHRRHFVDPFKNEKYKYRFYGFDHPSGKKGGFHNIDTEKCDFKPDWKAFNQACNEDPAIWPVVRAIESLHLNNVTLEGCEIQIWSGRCESVRDRTEHWLKYIVGEHTYSKLRMRPIDSNTPDDEMKESWLDEVISEGKTIDFVFDDRPKVVRMWRRRGIFVFNCCQHEQEF